MTINWEGALHPTAGLGQGIVPEVLGDRRLDEFLPVGSFRVPWSPDQLAQEMLWLPKNLTYSLLGRE